MAQFKPGWADEAGKEAAERERGERFAPVVMGEAKRHYVPVLPVPKPEQHQNAKRAQQRHRARQEAEANLDRVLGSVED